MGKRYQVIGALAQVTVQHAAGPSGHVKKYLHLGAVIDEDQVVHQHEIDHNIDVGLMAEIDGAGVPGIDSEGNPVLDNEDGSAPPEGKPGKGAAKPELVAWVVANRGVSDADANGMTKDQLRAKVDEEPGEAVDDDSGPDSDAALTEMRERAIRAGYNRTEVEKASVADLRALLT